MVFLLFLREMHYMGILLFLRALYSEQKKKVSITRHLLMFSSCETELLLRRKLLSNSGCLTDTVTQVIQLRSSYTALTDDLNLINVRRMNG